MNNQKKVFAVIFGIGLVFVLILLSVLYLNYVGQKKFLEKNALNYTQSVSDLITDKLESIFKNIAQTPNDLKAVIENVTLTDSELKAALRQILEQNSSIYGLCPAYERFSFDPKIEYYEPYYYREGDSLSFVNYDIMPEDYFEKDWYKTPKDLNAPAWIEPYGDTLLNGVVIMTTYSIPFYNVDGSVRGVIASDVFLSEFQEYLANFKILEKGSIFTFSAENNILTHKDTSYVMNETMRSLTEKWVQPVLEQIADSINNNKNGSVIVESIFDNPKSLVKYFGLSSGWGVVVIFPYDELYRDLIALKQKNIIIGISGFLLILAFSIFIYFVLMKKISDTYKKQLEKQVNDRTLEIREKNDELVAIGEELRQNNEELTVLNEDIEHKKNIIEKAHKNITDSINYAKSLQTSLLTSDKTISSFIEEYFIFYKPKDIVSGDFYYVNKIGDELVFVVADCTGHGVPGGFMTIIGITYLHEIVRQNKLHHAGEILDNLRQRVQKTFRTFGSDNSSGMDLVFCTINTKTNIMQYSGAFNPLYVMRNSEIIEYSPTKNPIGFFPKEVPFKNHEIHLMDNDLIYLFSDGYQDQFGGGGMRKFTRNRLRSLMLESHMHPLDKQKEIFENILVKWQGEVEQIDDITVMALKWKFEN